MEIDGARSAKYNGWSRSSKPNLAIFSLTIFVTFSLALSWWKYIKLLNKLIASASNLSSCCNIPHGIYCGFFREQLLVYYAFYPPPNPKPLFGGYKPGFCPNLTLMFPFLVNIKTPLLIPSDYISQPVVSKM